VDIKLLIGGFGRKVSDEKGVEKRVIIQMTKKMFKKYTVMAILKVLGIPRSTYYCWQNGFEEYINVHEDLIIEIFKATKYLNGHQKIKSILKRKYKIDFNRNTVQRIMQKHHVPCKVKPKRKWKSQGENK
jgi:putative transposase